MRIAVTYENGQIFQHFDTQRHLRLMKCSLLHEHNHGKDIHVVSMDVETIAATEEEKNTIRKDAPR